MTRSIVWFANMTQLPTSFAEDDFGIRICCREVVREEHKRSVENGLEEAQMSEVSPKTNDEGLESFYSIFSFSRKGLL